MSVVLLEQGGTGEADDAVLVEDPKGGEANMPTTAARRFTSLLRCSSGLVLWSLTRCCSGKAMSAGTSCSASFMQVPSFGQRVRSWLATCRRTFVTAA
jgi:hypothetical protein